MRFGQVVRSFREGFRDWDARSKSAFVLALVLLIVVLIVGGRLPEENRSSAVIGVIGLLVTLQAIFLYANRGMVTTATKARRLLLEGEYDQARHLLEQTVRDIPDIQALILLGNAYRMLGEVDESYQTLTKALQMAPDQHFLLYSLGRTLMVRGSYAQAAEMFQRALERGAPEFAAVDLAEADFRAQRTVRIPTGAFAEAHVALMAAYLSWQSRQGQPPSGALIEAGLPFWEKSAARFAHTRYGIDLQRDLATLRGLPH